MRESEGSRVVPLGVEPPPEPPAPRVKHSRLYSLSLVGMTLGALTGIAAMMAFVSVRWPGTSGRYVVGIFVLAIVVFLSSAATAVFTAARETYAPTESGRSKDDVN